MRCCASGGQAAAKPAVSDGRLDSERGRCEGVWARAARRGCSCAAVVSGAKKATAHTHCTPTALLLAPHPRRARTPEPRTQNPDVAPPASSPARAPAAVLCLEHRIHACALAPAPARVSAPVPVCTRRPSSAQLRVGPGCVECLVCPAASRPPLYPRPVSAELQTSHAAPAIAASFCAPSRPRPQHPLALLSQLARPSSLPPPIRSLAAASCCRWHARFGCCCCAAAGAAAAAAAAVAVAVAHHVS